MCIKCGGFFRRTAFDFGTDDKHKPASMMTHKCQLDYIFKFDLDFFLSPLLYYVLGLSACVTVSAKR